MKRIYYPYDKWEEYHNGMWRILHSLQEQQEFAKKAATLMKNNDDFKNAMLRAINEWPISTEMNLSAKVMNRRAWLGHAGCCVAVNSPEEATRLGWHLLNEDEQREANRMADEVIAIWEDRYAKNLSR